jgi:hypothetical protein
MDALNGSTTHTIRFTEPPNRAFRFLIGLAILYAVWRCRSIIADFLTINILAALNAGPLEGVGTVTGTVLPLLIEFVIGLGGVAIFVGSLGWSVVVDLFAGTVQSIAAWRNRITATNAARVAATSAATGSATASATSAAVGSATGAAVRVGSVSITDPQLIEFARLVQNTLREQRGRLDSIATTLEQMQNQPPAASSTRKPSSGRRAPSKRSTKGAAK